MRSSRIVHAICATLDAFVFGFMPSSAKAPQINGVLDSPPRPSRYTAVSRFGCLVSASGSRQEAVRSCTAVVIGDCRERFKL